jgi:hypothetical protein
MKKFPGKHLNVDAFNRPFEREVSTAQPSGMMRGELPKGRR